MQTARYEDELQTVLQLCVVCIKFSFRVSLNKNMIMELFVQCKRVTWWLHETVKTILTRI